MRVAAASVVLLVLAAACKSPQSDPNAEEKSHEAHDAYVQAINSNDLDHILAMLTEDVVFMAPNAAPLLGKAAVRPWVAGYLRTFRTHWDKPVQEFVVNGEWAFERYGYHSMDTPLAGGPAVEDTGWGLIVYHHDADGVWRVARDAWGSDRPMPAKP